MTKDKTQDFSNDMRTKYDIILDIALKGTDNKVSAFFNRVEMVIMLEIQTQNPMFREDRITPKQKEAIWKAMLEQGAYIIYTGDTNLMSGYDPISNSAIPIEQLRERAFSPLARKILLTSGLLYRGIGNRSYDGYVRY